MGYLRAGNLQTSNLVPTQTLNRRFSTELKQDYVERLPDYFVETDPLVVNPLIKKEIVQDEHPIETMAKVIRAKNDVFSQLGSNQVLLTNLPLNSE